MRIEKGDGLVVEISMKCNCDCNKKHNEDNFENEMLDKDGVLDLISSFCLSNNIVNLRFKATQKDINNILEAQNG